MVWRECLEVSTISNEKYMLSSFQIIACIPDPPSPPSTVICLFLHLKRKGWADPDEMEKYLRNVQLTQTSVFLPTYRTLSQYNCEQVRAILSNIWNSSQSWMSPRLLQLGKGFSWLEKSRNFLTCTTDREESFILMDICVSFSHEERGERNVSVPLDNELSTAILDGKVV